MPNRALPLIRQPLFSSATLAVAVNYFVALGEDAAVRELTNLGVGGEFISEPQPPPQLPPGSVWSPSFSVNERVGWVCRILFAPKGGSPLRPPLYGALSLPYDSMPLESWPLFPLALSGRTYFVLSQGYSGEGHPESLAEYVAYCRDNGIFRKTPVLVPTREQALEDAAALRRSRSWGAIRWPGSSPQESTRSTNTFIWAFIQAQAEAIPGKQPSAAPRQ